VTTRAWPFMIAPTASAPPRLVVAPDWALADRSLLAGLRRTPEEGRASYLDTPGARAVLAPVHTKAGNFCLVYRVIKVRLRDYGLDSHSGGLGGGGGPSGDLGDELARDQAHREIEATEGLVLRCDEEEARLVRVGTADLARVHALVTEPYLSYWRQPASFQLRPAGAFLLSGNGGRVVILGADNDDDHDLPGSPTSDEPADTHADDPVGTRNRTGTAGVTRTTSIAGASEAANSAGPGGPEAGGEPTSNRSGTEPEIGSSEDPGRARLRRAVVRLGLAAVVVAGIAFGITRPWSSPSAQPPQDLSVRAKSATTISLTWQRPASGTPDHYELSFNGVNIGIPGTHLRYRVKDLKPVTSYRLQLLAFAYGTKSRPSNPVQVTTPYPPKPLLWQAPLLRGMYTTLFKTLSSTDGSYPAGKSWYSSWYVALTCGSYNCPVNVSGSIIGAAGEEISFSIALPWRGTMHKVAIQRDLEKCGASWMPATLTFTITPAGQEAYDHGTWVASQWQGTLTIANEYVPATVKQPACPSSSVTMSISGEPPHVATPPGQ
jgi:hypothetical protein